MEEKNEKTNSENTDINSKELFKTDLRQSKEKNSKKILNRIDVKMKESGLKSMDIMFKLDENIRDLKSEKSDEIKKNNFKVAEGVDKSILILSDVKDKLGKGIDKDLDKQVNAEEKNKDNDKSKGIDKDNFDYLMKKLKYTGFPVNDYTKNKVSEIMKSEDSGKFKHKAHEKQTMKGNSVEYDVKINKAKGDDKFYFGGYDAKLENKEKGLDRSLSMASSKNTYTAKEALNLLEGRMVKREFQNGKSGFVGMDFKSEKNKYGNHKLNIVSKDDKIDVKDAVERSAIVMPKSDKYSPEKMKAFLIKSLEKGNLVDAHIKSNKNESIAGKVKFDPFKGEIDHYAKIDDYNNKFKKIPNENLELNQGVTAENNEESKQAVVKR